MQDQGFKLHECADVLKELGDLMELYWTDGEVDSEDLAEKQGDDSYDESVSGV